MSVSIDLQNLNEKIKVLDEDMQKLKLKLNGLICSIKLFVSSSPVHLGTAGIS